MRSNRYETGRLHCECAPYRKTHQPEQDVDDRDPSPDQAIDASLLYITAPDGREIIIRDGARGPRRIEW